MSVLRPALAGLALASFAALAWVPGGCSDATHGAFPEAGVETSSTDAMGCKRGGSGCTTNEECCAQLCDNQRCANRLPPPLRAPCPESRPAQGAGCLANGVACEYGESPVVSCDEVVRCNDWQWQVSEPDLTDPACSLSGTGCPASLDGVVVGQSCAPLLAHCDYGGVRCECAQNAPVAGWPATWKCPAAYSGGALQGLPCPPQRPRLGTFCDQLGLSCDYGACQIRGGNRVTCHVFGGPGAGIWVDQPMDCSCPTTLPDARSRCTNVGLSCEFGPSPVASCDSIATCFGVGAVGGWQVFVPDGGPPCAPAPPSQCPTSGERLDGLPCSTPLLDCDYSDMRCECVTSPGAEPATTWRCTDPRFAGPGCGPRPLLGTACPQQGQLCNYGACDIAGGNLEMCSSNGVWNAAYMPYGGGAPIPPPLCPLACPAIAPDAGTPCSRFGACEYGTSNVFQCDTIAVCWPVAPPVGDGGPGAPPPPPPPGGFGFTDWLLSQPDAGGKSCQASSPAACPPSFDSVVRDAGCDGAPALCDYPQGRCRCAAADGSAAGNWTCQDPAPPCPKPRPRLGTRCTREQEGLVCAYDPCDGVAGFAEECQQSVWIRLDVNCGSDAGSALAPGDAG